MAKKLTLDQLRQKTKSAMDGHAEHESVIERKDKYRIQHGKITDEKALALLMKEVDARKEALEAELKEVNAEYDVIRLELIPTLFEDKGIENIKLEGIGRVQLAADLYVSVRSGMKDELFAWLKARKLGALIQPGVNSSTLKAFVKERIKSAKEVPSEQLNVTPFTRASIVQA